MEPWTRVAGATVLVGLPGPESDRATLEWLAGLGPAGVILFRRNLESPRQTAELLSAVRGVLGGPILLAVDQEGGRVSRIEPWVGATPTAAVLGRAGSTAVSRFAAATARALGALGFNLDFAPVVDLCEPDAPNGIGDRAFSANAQAVCESAGAFLNGLQSEGVAACLKHFPGLGSTRADSHVVLPTAEGDLMRLEREDLEPYRQLGSRAACVMVSHASFPALDSSPGPATLSRAIVTELLKGRLGYRGLVVSDDMDMGAVAPLDTDGAAAVRAMDAGCDLLLYCADPRAADRAVAALARRAAEDPAFGRRLGQAADAVRATARRWDVPRPREDAGAALAALRAVASQTLA